MVYDTNLKKYDATQRDIATNHTQFIYSERGMFLHFSYIITSVFQSELFCLHTLKLTEFFDIIIYKQSSVEASITGTKIKKQNRNLFKICCIEIKDLFIKNCFNNLYGKILSEITSNLLSWCFKHFIQPKDLVVR